MVNFIKIGHRHSINVGYGSKKPSENNQWLWISSISNVNHTFIYLILEEFLLVSTIVLHQVYMNFAKNGNLFIVMSRCNQLICYKFSVLCLYFQYKTWYSRHPCKQQPVCITCMHALQLLYETSLPIVILNVQIPLYIHK